MGNIRKNILGKTGLEIIAEENGEVAGNVILTLRKSNVHVGYINVKKKFEGGGIGHTLLDEVESLARQSGRKQITGTIIPVPGSEQKVLTMLKKRGFTIDKKGGVSLNLEESN